MSWLSSGLKTIRKAVGLPPITLGNVAKAIAPAIPIPGLSYAINKITGGSSAPGAAPEPSLTELVKAQFDAFIAKTATQASQVKTAITVGEQVQSAQALARDPVMWVIGGGLLLLVLGRRGS